MPLTAAEQYLLELVNRARLDPLAEAERYGITLNQGLSAGTIDATAKQVLAPNELLNQAAADHSLWMLAADVFSHTGSGGSSAGQRMQAAGYAFTGSWTWGENLAWTGTTGTMNLNSAIDQHHRGLFLSPGHRTNLMNETFREIGIGQEAGKFLSNGTNWNASMLTEKFAKSGSSVFVTGVVYDDLDGNDFYTIGEGRGGAVFRIGGLSDTTETAGGYALKIAPSAAALVEISYGGFDGVVALDVSGGNGKVDYVVGGPVLLSASATLVSGVEHARLLGVDDLDLTGDGAANWLEGNKGDNRIEGGAGDDTLIGGEGADTMDGGDGSDVYEADAFDFIEDSGTYGFDLVRFSGDAAVVMNLGLVGIERVVGADGNDLLDGSDMLADLAISGGGGDDQIDGGGGNDMLMGGGATLAPEDMAALSAQMAWVAAALQDFGDSDGFAFL
ncbi:CAP domain-containing protein [Palleronia sp. KMU-117]|uniref:CAP domain-containing protein n=1 Tax=Palleronia sp. KMU-117 TaxID=3434108 RepID=UPI003D761EC3